MAPYPTITPRYYDCDPGYNWYICNIGGQSYYGCCSVEPCGSINFCPAEHQDVKSANSGLATIAPTSTSTLPAAHPRSTSPALNDNVSPNNGGLPPADGNYGPASTISSTNADTTNQTGVAIAATVGTLVLIGFIVVCLWLYRFLLRRSKEAKEEERRIRKERRHQKVYVKSAPPSSTGSSSDGTSTGCGRRRSWSKTPSPGISPSSYEGTYSHPYTTEIDYQYETKYGVHYNTQLPAAPPSTARRPTRNTSRSRDRGDEAFHFEEPPPIVPPVSPKSNSVYPDVSPFDERNPNNYRRHSADPGSPVRAATMPPEGYFGGIPERVAPRGGVYVKTHGNVSNNPFRTLHRPVGYQGGPVTPVWDSDGVLQEVYVQDWTGIKH
ncbi:hypothetical protein BR93DRAFT_804918 [Coniochaeta sp. PMI_546]|nr:hypothetical protein BR93DRAFT_804918 [Coniochaeta sp. PMI_546]